MEQANYITRTKFTIASNNKIEKEASIDITSQLLTTTTFKRNIINHNNFGPDPWSNQLCLICKQTYKNCYGHFGIFSNILIYKSLYLSYILKILNNVCGVCKSYREKNAICKVCKTAKTKYVIFKYIKLYKNNKVDPIEIAKVTNLNQKQIIPREQIYEILSMVSPDTLKRLGLNIDNGSDLMWTVFPILSKRYRKDNKVGDRIMKNHIESLYQQMTRYVSERIVNINNTDKINKIDNNLQIIEMQLVDGGKYKRSDGSMNNTILPKLMKKEGIIINDLICKRVNNCIRAVIIPANEHISVNEIGIPKLYAQELIVYEYVTQFNIHLLNSMLRNKEYPQIKYRKELINGQYVNRSSIGIDKLNIGDLIARSLLHGDEVLANRAPTLTKNSILCFKAYITDGKALSLNLATCNGFGADFDGDQMNIFVLKNPSNRIECNMKMNPSENIISSGFSGLLIALTQDLVACIRILTTKTFYINEYYMKFLISNIKLSRTASPIYKHIGIDNLVDINHENGILIYSGKSIFSLLLPQELNYILYESNSNNIKLKIENGELIEGEIDKLTVMKQQKGLLNAINDLYCEEVVIKFLDNLHKLSSNMLKIYGITTGLHDFYFQKDQMNKINISRNIKYTNLYTNISKYQFISPSIDLIISEEIKNIQNSNEILSEIMKTEYHHFHDIITCGAKGTTGDINKMIYSVGQIFIGSERYNDRCPFIAKYDNKSKYGLGIVENGYLDGLSIPDIQMCNQNALNSAITTQLATAKPGYINTKINETVRDFISVSDFTIRNPVGDILIQHYFNSFDNEKESLYIINFDLKDILFNETEIEEYNIHEYLKFNSYIKHIYSIIELSNYKLNKYEIINKISIYLPFDFELLLLNNNIEGECCKDMKFIIENIDNILENYNTSPYKSIDNINKIPMTYCLYYYFNPKRIKISKKTYEKLFSLIYNKIIFAQLESGNSILLRSGTSYLSVVTQELLKSIHQAQSKHTEKSLEDNFNVSKTSKDEIITSYVEDSTQKYKRLYFYELLNDIKCTFSKDLNKRVYKILYSDKEEKIGLLFKCNINMLSMIENKLLLSYIYSNIITNLNILLETDTILTKSLNYLHVSTSTIFEEPNISILIDGSIQNVRLFIIHFIKLIKKINIRESNITSMFIIDREFKFKQCRISGITYKESFDLNFIKKDFILTSNLYSVYEIYGVYGYLCASLINLFLIGKDNKVNPKNAAAISCVICYNNTLISLNRQGFDKISVSKWSTIAFESQVNNLIKTSVKNITDYGKTINSQMILGHKLKIGTNHSKITYNIDKLKSLSTYKLSVTNENQLYNIIKMKQSN